MCGLGVSSLIVIRATILLKQVSKIMLKGFKPITLLVPKATLSAMMLEARVGPWAFQVLSPVFSLLCPQTNLVTKIEDVLFNPHFMAE